MRPEAKQRKIPPEQLISMDLYVDDFPLGIALDYARPDNVLFGEPIYRPDARLFLYEDLAKIVLKAAKTCGEEHNLRLVLHDGLRTIGAQQRMLETQRVRDNPHWLEEPRLLSLPGTGGHPRGMAVDISLETMDGETLDMGTVFDFLASDSSPEHNPAHRAHPHLNEQVKQNRTILDQAMLEAAESLGVELLLLPQEWWDFRLPAKVTELYAPLSDHDLPPEMRMMEII